MLLVFGLVNLPLSMLMSPTAAVLPNFYLDYGGVLFMAAPLLLAWCNPLGRREHAVLARRLARRKIV